MLISGCCASASSTSFVHPTKVSAGEDSALAEDDVLIEDEDIFVRGEAMSSNDDVRDGVLYERNYLAIDVSNLFQGHLFLEFFKGFLLFWPVALCVLFRNSYLRM